MKRLKAATRKHQVQLRVAIKTQADKEMTLLRQSFDLWVRLERGRLLQRVRDTRVLRTSLSKWQSKLARVDKLQGRSLIVPSADLLSTCGSFRCRLGTQDTTQHTQPLARCLRRAAECYPEGRSCLCVSYKAHPPPQMESCV